MNDIIYSTGIDIGTTTTHLIISRLTICVKEGFGCAPKVEIENKEILYMSKIYFTPIENGKISAKGVKEIIDGEYKKAGISPDMLKSGAVIITGESARKRNAKELLFEISKYAGDFIVAEAGGNTESILAGKGAGGQALSQKELSKICTVDIGGGTTNCAVFDDGEIIDASCIDAGGRLVKIKSENGKNIISDISDYIKSDFEKAKLDVNIGDIVSESKIKDICTLIKDKIICELKRLPKCDKYIFSGGVNDCIGKNYGDFEFDDLGVLLAKEIRQSDFWQNNLCLTADNSIRATVIGAGNFSFEISGSTIANIGCKLPIKNIPCVKINVTKDDDITNACDGLCDKISRFSLTKPVAVSFNGYTTIKTDNMLLLAENLSKQLQIIIDKKLPVILLIEKDIGKAFGICMKKYLPVNYPILCIDCVNANDNDFLDIGESVGGGKAVPVSIKQLVFSV